MQTFKPSIRRQGVLNQKHIVSMALALSFIVLCLYSDFTIAALVETDKVAELKALTTETGKIVKNGCYIAGSVSALVAAVSMVASQNLKVATSSAAVTLIAFKAATFLSGTLLI
jgi:hypothetical protein